MQNNQYISVLSQAATSEDLVFNLETLDASTNITISATVTGTTPADSEFTVAKRIKDQLTTITTQNSASFNGVPSDIADEPNATFRFNHTDHVVEVYSECRFNLTLTNSTGAIIKIGDSPTLITVPQATSLAVYAGEEFEDSNGVAYTSSQIADVIEILSAKLIARMNNPIVATTYRFEKLGNWDRSMKLEHTPVIYVDPPTVNFPGFTAFLIDATGTTDRRYYYFERDGWVSYKYAQEVLQDFEPFDYGNMFRMTYTAGEDKIPLLVKTSLVELVSEALESGEITELRGGSFGVKLASSIDSLNSKLILLKDYVQ